MARYKAPIPSGMLDEFLVATRPTTAEDEYGELTVSSNTTIAQFWAEVEEQRSDTTIDAGKKRLERTIKIMARSADVEDIDIDDEITVEGRDITYQVNDIQESEWKYGTVLMAQHKI